MKKKITIVLAAVVLLTASSKCGADTFEKELETKDYTKEELEAEILGKWVVVAIERFSKRERERVTGDNEYVIFTETEATVNLGTQPYTYTWEATQPYTIHAYISDKDDDTYNILWFEMKSEMLVLRFEDCHYLLRKSGIE